MHTFLFVTSSDVDGLEESHQVGEEDGNEACMLVRVRSCIIYVLLLGGGGVICQVTGAHSKRMARMIDDYLHLVMAFHVDALL